MTLFDQRVLDVIRRVEKATFNRLAWMTGLTDSVIAQALVNLERYARVVVGVDAGRKVWRLAST